MGDVTIGVGRSASSFNVFFWVADYMGCGYQRCALPGMALRNRGWKVEADSRLQDHHLSYDLIVAQRTCSYGPSMMLNIMREAGMPIIYETDDDLFHIDRTNTSFSFFEDKQIRQRMTQNIKIASAVTVTTEALAVEIRKLNPNVFVIPSYLDKGVFDVVPLSRPVDKIIIGWAGSPSHAGDFGEAENALQQVMRADENVLYQSIGHDFGAEMGLPENRRAFTPWLERTVDLYEHLNFDIGIAPLAPTKFNTSKSAIKAVEYGAMKIPIVASRWGPYADYVKHGETGLLCKNTDQWVKALRALINDSEMRREMGENGYKQALSYIQDDNIDRRMEIYKDIIDAAPATPKEIGETIVAELSRRSAEFEKV